MSEWTSHGERLLDAEAEAAQYVVKCLDCGTLFDGRDGLVDETTAFCSAICRASFVAGLLT